jgi:hypothetical protein
MEPIAKAVRQIVTSRRNDETAMGSSSSINSISRWLPILIFPGFMSSGLEVKQSNTCNWQGKQLWPSIKLAGFALLYFASALKDLSVEYNQNLHLKYQ